MYAAPPQVKDQIMASGVPVNKTAEPASNIFILK